MKYEYFRYNTLLVRHCIEDDEMKYDEKLFEVWEKEMKYWNFWGYISDHTRPGLIDELKIITEEELFMEMI